MTPFWFLVVVTLCVATVDWWSVATERRQVELVFKPLTMIVLIAAALSLPEPASESSRLFLVFGLVCSLAGDVFLMFEEKYFVAGLASFLIGHVMYVVALVGLGDLSIPLLAVGAAGVVVAAVLVGSRIVGGARRADSRLTLPVAVYIGVISTMVVMAVGSAVPAAIAGALLFYASDAVLGWNRFVKPIPNGRVIIHCTYHLGQIGLVLALMS